MSWFLKYRPKQIKDLDLVDVRQTFQNMMDSGKLPQTMLFAGPKGTGKTSTSRIIGAMLNDPANEKIVERVYFKKEKPKGKLKEPKPTRDFAKRVYRGQSFVVQEMDAASNRGIDDIRSLRKRISLPPQEGKMAVYILDEVHMLTNEAFNALLKILEEPPQHVVFILATTELHKVPPTVVSRCTTVSFHKASLEEIIGRLEKILKEEDVEYEAEALAQIAKRADGSFRDAVKLAELAAQSGDVTAENLEAVIGGSAEVRVEKLVEAVLAKDEVKVAKVFQELRAENFDQDYFYQTLFNWLHTNLLRSIGVEPGEPNVNQKVSTFLLKALLNSELKADSPISFLPLEVTLLDIIDQAKSKSGSNSGQSKQDEKTEQKKVSAKKNKSQSKAKKSQSKKEAKQNQTVLESDLEKKVSSKNPLEPETVNQDGESLSKVICERWEELVKSVSKHNSTLGALLRSGKPKAGKNGTARIDVYYRFHQEQLQQPKFKSIIESCGQKITGKRVAFKFVLVNPPKKAELLEVPAETEKLEALAEETLM